MLIRKANADDYDHIIRLMEHGIHEWAYDIWGDVHEWVDSTCTLEHVQKIDEKGIMLVAVDAATSNIVGTAHGYPHKTNSHVWVLGGIYVTVKKNGIGSDLTQVVLDHGSSLGYMEAHSYVYEHNIRSLKFLDKYGAIEIDDEITAGNRYLTLSIPIANGSLLLRDGNS